MKYNSNFKSSAKTCYLLNTYRTEMVSGLEIWINDFEITIVKKGPPSEQTYWLGFEAQNLLVPDGGHAYFPAKMAQKSD